VLLNECCRLNYGLVSCSTIRKFSGRQLSRHPLGSNKMKKSFEYLYYSYCQIAMNAVWPDRNPKLVASSKMVINVMLLFFTIYAVFMATTRIEFLINKYWGLVLTFVLFGLIHYYFSSNRLESIEKAFKRESDRYKKYFNRGARYVFALNLLLWMSAMFCWALRRGNPLW
jgi:uncharacterized membrane protein